MFVRPIFIWICFLFVTHSEAQHTYGSFYTNDAFVNYVLSENKTEKAVIIMIPGANLSSYIYVTTPDGRKGWSDLFADKGYDVYMVNDPRYDFATGGFIGPYTIPANGKPATPGSAQGWQNDIWRRWGFGSSQGNPYPDALFPTDYFDEFAKNYPYIGASSEGYSEAIQAVMDTIGSEVWLMAHSAGASRAVSAARQKKEQVNGLILIEPAGPPDIGDFPDLDGLHMLGVYGDYIESRNQTNRKAATEAAAELFIKAGGIADVVSLPEDSLVFGNSHLLMQDRNSEDIFIIIEKWLKQFTTSSISFEAQKAKDILIQAYPNPTNGVFNVRFSDDVYDDGQIIVTDNFGKKISTTPIKSIETSISINSSAGIYYVLFQKNSGELIFIDKILKH